MASEAPYKHDETSGAAAGSRPGCRRHARALSTKKAQETVSNSTRSQTAMIPELGHFASSSPQHPVAQGILRRWSARIAATPNGSVAERPAPPER